MLRNYDFSGFRLVLLAIVMLIAGFLFGTLQYKPTFFTFAQNSESRVYKGETGADVTAPEQALRTARNLEKAISYAAEKARPGVVTIYTRKQVQVPGFPFQPPGGDPRFDEFFRRFFDVPESQSREVTGLGSGVIMRSDGYVLTNHHVVAQADEIEVLLSNQESVEAEIVGSDAESDLAVLKINRTQLPSLEFADSSQLKVGEYAIAIGSPFQLRNSVSVGHISALHRAINAKRFEDLIQTDAAINRGNSGGPLINIEGEVIGINTLILSEGSAGNQGVGFAISADLAKRTAEDLIEFGKVKRPWLGVVIQELTTEMSKHVGTEDGVLVAEVKEGSPADEAGIEAGDVIVEFEGKPVPTPHDLQRFVLSEEIDGTVEVKVYKQDEGKKTLTITLGELPTETEESPSRQEQPEEEQEQPENLSQQLGLELENISSKAARQQGISPPRRVVQISDIRRGSPAAKANLRPGDIIMRIGDQPIENKKQFNRLLSQLKEAGENKALLHVRRDSNFFTLLPIE